MRVPAQYQVDALVEAMSDLLSDMAEDGHSVCNFAKAKARIAYEPFRTDPEVEEGIMPLAEAQRIFMLCDVGW